MLVLTLPGTMKFLWVEQHSRVAHCVAPPFWSRPWLFYEDFGRKSPAIVKKEKVEKLKKEKKRKGKVEEEFLVSSCFLFKKRARVLEWALRRAPPSWLRTCSPA